MATVWGRGNVQGAWPKNWGRGQRGAWSGEEGVVIEICTAKKGVGAWPKTGGVVKAGRGGAK